MVVVDSSVWVDFLNGRSTRETEILDKLIETDLILMGDLILAEVLQGIRDEGQCQRTAKELNALPFAPMVGRTIALASAQNYRRLRKEGTTIRKTIDVIIATFCIEGGFDLLHADRDFTRMAAPLGLNVL